MRMFLESLNMALHRLVSHKVRSLLTMLGIVIGTGAVVALISIGKGASGNVASNIKSLGTNLLTVNAGSSTTSGVRSASGSATTLTVADGNAIAKLDGVARWAPEATSSQVVIAGTENTTTSIVGTTPAYMQVRAFKLRRGSFLTALSESKRLPVAVLGSSVVDTLGLDPDAVVGQQVSIGGTPFTVIGVLQAKGSSGPNNPDDQILVPLKVLQRRLTGSDNIRTIDVSLEDGVDSTEGVNTLSALLRVRHGITDSSNDDFTVTSQSQLVETFSSVNKTLTYLLGGVAAISLIVGGIGIMNMMLVSVQERTYEIGLRKAVGARRRDILTQFVTEAIALSVLGGLIGVGVGVAAARITSLTAGWQTVITTGPILLAFGFSVLIGVVFGVFPAYKAARLDPVSALRYT